MLLDVKPRTVVRYLEEGKLEYKRLPGGHRRVLTESVKKYREKKQLHDPQLIS